MDVYGLCGVYGYRNANKKTSTAIHRFLVVVVHQILALSTRAFASVHPGLIPQVTCRQDSADLVTRTLGSTMAVIVSCTESHKRRI